MQIIPQPDDKAFQWPDHEPSCCTPAQAWSWTNVVTEMAVYGDDLARAALPDCVDHALAAEFEVNQ